LQLNRSTYVNWVEGAKAVSYADGVLTVRARHIMARDWLAERLNYSIEETASALAERPITIRYIVDSPFRLAPELSPPE
jgi:chromosomal replication initiation ATPase DnaA